MDEGMKIIHDVPESDGSIAVDERGRVWILAAGDSVMLRVGNIDALQQVLESARMEQRDIYAAMLPSRDKQVPDRLWTVLNAVHEGATTHALLAGVLESTLQQVVDAGQKLVRLGLLDSSVHPAETGGGGEVTYRIEYQLTEAGLAKLQED